MVFMADQIKSLLYISSELILLELQLREARESNIDFATYT